MTGSSSDAQHNRAFWDADADEYQATHGALLAATPTAWGVWRIPESELRVLGDVDGRDVLELGCGAAQWSAALEYAGARCFGLDASTAQLGHARHANGRALPLLAASAEALPLRAASIDVAFCDHGAMSFCDPRRTLPEVARVLRPGGLLAFCVTDPLVYLTYDRKRDRQTRKLRIPATGLGRIQFDEGTIDWSLTPGEWIRALRAHSFDVEDLIELRAPKGATTTYEGFVPYKWARRWPAEQIWRARKRG